MHAEDRDHPGTDYATAQRALGQVLLHTLPFAALLIFPERGCWRKAGPTVAERSSNTRSQSTAPVVVAGAETTTDVFDTASCSNGRLHALTPG